MILSPSHNALDRVTSGYDRLPNGLYVPFSVKASSEDDSFLTSRPGNGAYAAMQRDPTRRDQLRRYGSADADMLLSIRELRSISQALMRNNPFYRMGILAMVRDMAHSEFRVDPKPQTDFVKLEGGRVPTSEETRRYARESSHAFNVWKRTPESTGLLDWRMMMPLLIRSWHENGDCILVRQYAPDSDMQPATPWGRRFSFHWKLLEAGQVAEDALVSDSVPEGHTVSGGVERDAMGRQVALHIYNRHPGDLVAGGNFRGLTGRFDIQRIPWRDRFGRPNVVVLMEPERIGQSRGVPRGASAMLKAIDSDEYLDAALAQMKVAAMLVGAITRHAENAGVGRSAQSNSKDAFKSRPMRPAMFEELEVGESVSFSQPPNVGQTLQQGIDTMTVQYGGAIGKTYETITGDFRKTTYSSARASAEFAWMTVSMLQAIAVNGVCRTSYELNNEEAVVRGFVAMPGFNPARPDAQQLADPYGGCRDEWVNSSWIVPQMPRIDMEKELKGFKLMIDERLGTRRHGASRLGNDFDDVVSGQREDNELLDENNVNVSGDGGAVSQDEASEDDDPDARDKQERQEIDAVHERTVA